MDRRKRDGLSRFLGDTRYCETSIRLAQDADVLVHEATLAAAEEEQAHEYYHSTTHQAARVAMLAGAKRLIFDAHQLSLSRGAVCSAAGRSARYFSLIQNWRMISNDFSIGKICISIQEK
ncbi:hypothetical protein GCM10020331_041730 [Ectobacillus funiculus]